PSLSCCSISCFSPCLARTALATLSLHDALPISRRRLRRLADQLRVVDELHRAGVRQRRRLRRAGGVRRRRHPASHPRVGVRPRRSEEHTSELQSRENLVCRLLLEKKKNGKD